MDTGFVLFGFFAFLSYCSATMAGFGGVIIALTLGAHLYPIHWMLPVLLPLTFLANLYIFIRHRRYIDTPVLLKKILPFMATGLVAGFALFTLLRGDLLQTLFGVVVIVVSGREMALLIRHNRQDEGPLPAWMSNGTVFLAGLVHGIYASGGPLLVYAANRMNLSKSAFRSTLSVVWLLMNTFLIGAYAVSGRIDASTLAASVFLLPSLIAGVLAGERLHRRIPEHGFKIVVFSLLILSGVLITIK
ncbi:MAG: sulfite exporter TauE/SafE family protein [Desulfobacterales bacterium]|jgi:uncharacterized membrane protein YfcA